MFKKKNNMELIKEMLMGIVIGAIIGWLAVHAVHDCGNDYEIRFKYEDGEWHRLDDVEPDSTDDTPLPIIHMVVKGKKS